MRIANALFWPAAAVKDFLPFGNELEFLRASLKIATPTRANAAREYAAAIKYFPIGPTMDINFLSAWLFDEISSKNKKTSVIYITQFVSYTSGRPRAGLPQPGPARVSGLLSTGRPSRPAR